MSNIIKFPQPSAERQSQSLAKGPSKERQLLHPTAIEPFAISREFYRSYGDGSVKNNKIYGPMSRVDAIEGCRATADYERARYGYVMTQHCLCSKPLASREALIKEGRYGVRACRRNRSALSRCLGTMAWEFVPLSGQTFLWISILANATYDLGQSASFDPFSDARAEIYPRIQELGISLAIGWLSIVADARTTHLCRETGLLAPANRVLFHALVIKDEANAASGVLQKAFKSGFSLSEPEVFGGFFMPPGVDYFGGGGIPFKRSNERRGSPHRRPIE